MMKRIHPILITFDEIGTIIERLFDGLGLACLCCC